MCIRDRHVGAHQCAVCIVVFKEGNQRRGNRDNLSRCNVHIPVSYTHLDVYKRQLVILDRAKNLGTEQAVAFRLEGAIVDRFRLFYFAVGPGPDLVR